MSGSSRASSRDGPQPDSVRKRENDDLAGEGVVHERLHPLARGAHVAHGGE